MRTLLLAAISVLLASCAGPAPPRGSGEPPPSPLRAGLPPVPADEDEPSRGDRRVILYQTDPRSVRPVTLILVNRGNSMRKTRKARVALSLGNPRLPYKVLSEKAMGALLESLRAQGARAAGTSFVRGDERYFDAREVGNDRYRGVLYIEDNGVRTKVLGFRPRGTLDAAGQQLFGIFSRLKVLVTRWFNSTSRSETPISALAGNGP